MDFTKLSLKELREMAKEKGLSGISALRKAELIEELKLTFLIRLNFRARNRRKNLLRNRWKRKRASRKEKRRFTPMCLRRIIIQEITEGVIYPPTVITTITREIIIRTTITRTIIIREIITREIITREIITRTTIIIQMPKIIPIILLRIIHRMTMDLPKCCRSISRIA